MARKVLKAQAKIVRDDSRKFDKLVKSISEDKAGAVYIGILAEDSSGDEGGIGLAGIETDDSKQELAQLSERLWGLVLDGKITKFEALSRVGIFLQAKIRNKISAIKDPRNADATIAIKGFDNPLIGPAPSVMQKAINFVVRAE